MVFCIISLSNYEAAAFSLSLACDSCSSCSQQPHAPALHAREEPGRGTWQQAREGTKQAQPKPPGTGNPSVSTGRP